MKASKRTKLHEWQERAKAGQASCAKCKRTDHITVDHIVPMSLLEMLCIPKQDHYNDEENFEYLCRWCNKFKANRLDHLNPKTVPLLKKYIASYEQAITVTEIG